MINMFYYWDLANFGTIHFRTINFGNVAFRNIYNNNYL